MSKAHILGFPRIGRNRELKTALESYWSKHISLSQLLKVGAAIRQQNWKMQSEGGLDLITVGDFSWYDNVLDMAAMIGVIPERFRDKEHMPITLDTIFNMARGNSENQAMLACEMTKWFNTNYHYIVPELQLNQKFHLSFFSLFEEIEEARKQGYSVKPRLLGPLSFLWLAKTNKDNFDKLDLIEGITEIYAQILNRLEKLQIEWVQIEEPILAFDLPNNWCRAFQLAYERLCQNPLKVLLTTYFSSILHNIKVIAELPIQGLHVDLSQEVSQLDNLIRKLPSIMILSAGIINGRNIWKNDLSWSYQNLLKAKDRLQERLWIGTSCSLLHVPVDLDLEEKLDQEMKSWLSFAKQKISEVSILNKAINEGKSVCSAAFLESDACVNVRKNSIKIHKLAVNERLKAINYSHLQRSHDYLNRNRKQKELFHLNLFPTTTIGSFPQTQELRKLRYEYKAGELSEEFYEKYLCSQIQKVISAQEEIGLDVLVHGEVERNDMVEYFAELLEGFALTQNGWVQSFGSRCVKPPILFGDVSRPHAMTCTWIKYAQSLTTKPVKGMLTGPVSIALWSFVRDDQPLSETAMQIALVIQDEIADLEKNGIKIIQVDEPAFREGLPFRVIDWQNYLNWAVNAFRLATSFVKDETQIHTHMCYSEFNDIITSIAELDADVITLESSRSQKDLLLTFEKFNYPNEIGPGVYDVHSKRIPKVEEIIFLLEQAVQVVPAERLWVNPDCGLKTRTWQEVYQSLKNMVEAATLMRQKYRSEL